MSKLERIEDPWGDVWCHADDVDKLEAQNAELLGALKKVSKRHFCGCGAEGCRQCTEDCMILDLIEKAEGPGL